MYLLSPRFALVVGAALTQLVAIQAGPVESADALERRQYNQYPAPPAGGPVGGAAGYPQAYPDPYGAASPVGGPSPPVKKPGTLVGRFLERLKNGAKALHSGWRTDAELAASGAVPPTQASPMPLPAPAQPGSPPGYY